MNIFLNYNNKISICLKKLEKEGTIILPDNLTGLTLELPPKKNNSHMSCNVAMLLSKINKKSPLDLAKILSFHVIKRFFVSR